MGHLLSHAFCFLLFMEIFEKSGKMICESFNLHHVVEVYSDFF